MLFDLIEMHHVRILVVEIKETNLMGEDAPVKDALLRHHRMESVGIGINDAGADTTACALAAHD
jgi:EAL domain-containing protein (putative c-di-GMP-specific phosphodiesterase class I)